MSPATRAAAIIIGSIVGAGAAVAALSLIPAKKPSPLADLAPISGKLIDEAAGPIDEIVVYYVPEAERIFGPIYRAFLPTLDPSTRLIVLVPPQREGLDSSEKVKEFVRALPQGEALLSRTRIAVASQVISPWSKDRALVADGTPIGLFAPAEPPSDQGRRRADWNTPMDLARSFPGELRATVMSLDYDAGDFAVTGGRLLVDANLVGKNAGRGLDTPEKIAAFLRRAFSMEVVVLGREPGDVPRHHLSMYLTPLTDSVVLLGDPREGQRLVGAGYKPGETSPDSGEPLSPDFSEECLRRYDRAEAELKAAGFKVVKIPTVPFDDKTYFAYTNGVFETRAGRHIAWVPVYDVPALDEAALGVYRGLGWEVRPVPARAAFPFHGTIGCLANVLARGR
jgi:hypothetical protein